MLKTQSIFSGQVGQGDTASGATLPDGDHDCFRDSVIPMFSALLHPAFLSGVLQVGFLSACEQMVRSNARRIVALVKRMVSFWNGSVVNVPGNVSCEYVPLHSPVRQCAVPSRIAIGRPQPARTKLRAVCRNWAVFIYVLPKTLVNSLLSIFVAARSTATVRFGWARRISLEVFAAKRTLTLHSITLVDCLPRLRLFVQRAGNLLYSAAFSVRLSIAE